MTFEWAKRFLSSPAWAFFSNPGPSDFHFQIPLKCPVLTSPFCLTTSANAALSLAEDLANADASDAQEFGDQCPATPSNQVTNSATLSPVNSSEHLKNISPSTGPWSQALLAKASKIKIFEDDPILRRSCRQKIYKKGYKASGCKDKFCIACDAEPPTISPSIIKNLGATFCNVDVETLSKVTQAKRKKAAGPVGKKPIIKKTSKDGDDNDNATKKKKKPKK